MTVRCSYPICSHSPLSPLSQGYFSHWLSKVIAIGFIGPWSFRWFRGWFGRIARLECFCAMSRKDGRSRSRDGVCCCLELRRRRINWRWKGCLIERFRPHRDRRGSFINRANCCFGLWIPLRLRRSLDLATYRKKVISFLKVSGEARTLSFAGVSFARSAFLAFSRQ